MRTKLPAGMACTAFLAACAAGCERRPAGDAGAGLSLEATIARMRALHQDGALAALMEHIDPARRRELIDLLLAFDQLMAANRAAMHAVRAACPSCPTAAFDLSFLADELELFAPVLKIVDVRETGDSGMVVAQVARRVPLLELHFRRLDSRWVYLPGEPDPQLARLILDLARALERLAAQLNLAGRLEPEEVEREYFYRVGRRLRRASLPAVRPPAATVPASTARSAKEPA